MKVKINALALLTLLFAFLQPVFAKQYSGYSTYGNGSTSLKLCYETDAEATFGQVIRKLLGGGGNYAVDYETKNLWFSDNESVDRNMTYFRERTDTQQYDEPHSVPVRFDKCYFKDCNKLSYVDFADRPVTIEEKCFENCTSLKKVRLGQTQYKDTQVFKGLEYYEKTGLYWEYTSNCSTICTGAFVNCPKLDTVIVEGTETVIEDGAFTNCGDITIYCVENSKAEEYARKNNIKYASLSEYKENIYGDADFDGILTASDSAVVLQKVLNSSYIMPLEEQKKDFFSFIDVDCDGQLTANDSACILQKVLLPTYYMPVEANN